MMRNVVKTALWLAALLPGTASATWREATSTHFVIYSEEPAESLRAYAERLERLDGVLRRNQSVTTPMLSPADRLTIYALPTTAAVQRVIGRGSANVAGVYRGGVTGSLALTSRDGGTGKREMTPQIVLLHEYAHHFMLRYFPASYPAWFVEGYAEFASTMRFDPNGDIAMGLPVLHRGTEFNYAGDLSLADMMAGKARVDGIMYAKGWLLTHYLTFEPSRKGQLAGFLRAMSGGKSALEAATATFGDLRKLDGELAAYVRGKSFPYLLLKAADLSPGKIEIRDLRPGEAAILPVQMNSRFGVDGREAARLVKQARGVALAYPDDPAVQCALAEAEDDAGNPVETDAAAERVLAKDKNALCGLMFKGRAILGQARIANAAPDDRQWAEARRWFVRANRADSEHPWPMSMYYLSYRIARAAPNANARTALYGAQQRAPQDESIRMLAVLQLLRDGESEQAREMLDPLVAGRHGTAATALAGLYARIGHENPQALADELEKGPAPSTTGKPKGS